MELKKFVQETIQRIGEGIYNANNYLNNYGGAYVVSTNLSELDNENIIKTKDENGEDRIVTIINFEIPVEADYASIRTVDSQKATEQASIVKLKFQLPLALPKKSD